MTCRVVAPLILMVMVVVVVMVVHGAEMGVYQGSGLPEDSVSMSLSSTNLCKC
ncbi:hypothetical protein E2C01_069370 [Portunus trituberculatus]|uniref:Uncharacterized protein n=1 Tax=Portunus trituberculatus TaxID=210409 RepID=A0A5B7I0L6_PORTR|nr:hypothetical protein [Portunus trituberculatus]